MLLVYQLQTAEYLLQQHSRYFPDILLQQVIARCMQITYDRNTSAAIRDLKQQFNSAS